MLATQKSDSRCGQGFDASLPKADSKPVTANREDEDDDDDDSPAASPSLGSGPAAVNKANDSQAGTAKTGVSKAETAQSDDDDDDGDDDAKAQQVTACQPGDGKGTVMSKAAAADDDDDEDDDNDDDDSDAKPVKVKDYSEPVPGIQTHVDFYRDTDGNVALTTGSIVTSLLGDTLLQMRKDELTARDAFGTERVESTLLSATEKTSSGLAVTAALGTIRTLTWQSAVGSVKATQTLGDLSVSVNAAREMVVGTAQAIRERIMRSDLGLYLYNDFTDHISADGSFHHYMYSDGNRSDQAVLSPTYAIFLSRSQLNLGYSLTYMSFAQSVDRGYHDPRRLLSNDLTAIWKFDRGAYYGTFEASGGRVLVSGAASGQGANGSGMGQSSTATLGLRLAESARIETYWSNELYPGWSSTGLGFRIFYEF